MSLLVHLSTHLSSHRTNTSPNGFQLLASGLHAQGGFLGIMPRKLTTGEKSRWHEHTLPTASSTSSLRPAKNPHSHVQLMHNTTERTEHTPTFPPATELGHDGHRLHWLSLTLLSVSISSSGTPSLLPTPTSLLCVVTPSLPCSTTTPNSSCVCSTVCSGPTSLCTLMRHLLGPCSSCCWCIARWQGRGRWGKRGCSRSCCYVCGGCSVCIPVGQALRVVCMPASCLIALGQGVWWVCRPWGSLAP